MSRDKPPMDPFLDASGLLEGISNNDIDILSQLIGDVEPSTTAAGNAQPRINQSTRTENAVSNEEEHTGQKHLMKDGIDNCCLVCGDDKLRISFNSVCQACHQFYYDYSSKHPNLPKSCTYGTNDCVITRETRKSCAYCRLQKMYNIGYPRLSPKPHTGYRAYKSTSGRADIRPGSSAMSKSIGSTQTQEKDVSTRSLRAKPKKCCEVCGHIGLHKNHGVMVCASCRAFRFCKINRNQGSQTGCLGGRDDCEISPTNRACHSCRLKKIIALEKRAKDSKKVNSCSTRHQESDGIPQNESTNSSQWDSSEDISTSCDDESPTETQSSSSTSNKPESINEIDTKPRCKICGQPGFLSKCHACTTFIYYYKHINKPRNWPTECINGDHGCQITIENRGNCAYCRLQKAVSLGYIDPVDVDNSPEAHTEGSGPESNSQPRSVLINESSREKCCHICGDTRDHCVWARGVYRCSSCYKFTYRIERSIGKWPTRCIFGHKKCKITSTTKNHCAFCRTQKAISLGVIERPSVDHSSRHRVEAKKDQSRPNTIECPVKKRATIVEKGCKICGDTARCHKNRGVYVCQSCRTFIYKFTLIVSSKNWPTTCKMGDYKCEITTQTRAFCRYCRLKKSVSVGAFDHVPNKPIFKSSVEEIRDESGGQIRPIASTNNASSSSRKQCQICGDRNGCIEVKGVNLCIPCRSFAQRHKIATKKWPKGCINGDNKCDITLQNRSSCSYCRLQKAISLGAIKARHNDSPSSECIAGPSRGYESRPTNTSMNTNRSGLGTEKGCQICGDQLVCSNARGVRRCWACNKFVHKRSKAPQNWPTSCTYNDNNSCEITPRTRGLCSYCRLEKAISLGAIDRPIGQRPSGATGAPVLRVNPRSCPPERTNSGTKHIKECRVCGDTQFVFLNPSGIHICRTCRSFAKTREKGLKKWPTRCVAGQNNCTVSVQTRAYCAYCRMLKMVSIGAMSEPPKPVEDLWSDAMEEVEPTIEPTSPSTEVRGSQSSSDSHLRRGNVCPICNSGKTMVRFHHTVLCSNCYNFVQYKHKSRLVCYANCKIHFEHRPMCRYCRLKKAVALGLGPFIPQSLDNLDQKLTENKLDTAPEKTNESLMDNQQQRRDVGVEIITIDSSTAASSVSGHIDVDDNTEISDVGSQACDDVDNENDNDKEGDNVNNTTTDNDDDDNHVICDDSDDDTVSLQSTTSHDDIQYYGFSRCFYGDYRLGFWPSDMTRKKKSDERPLKQRKESFKTPSKRSAPTIALPHTTGLDSHLNLKLYTQEEEEKEKESQALIEQHQTDADEIALVRSIKTYSYRVSCDYESEPAGDREQIAKPNLTVILSSENALIDNRRMMTKKIKTDEEILASRHPESVIEPGEDCDDSTDSEIMEIDCDVF